MNWQPTEIQDAAKELGAQILCSKAQDPFAALAEAGLLDLEELPEICALLIEVGRSCSEAPVLEHLILGYGGEGPRRSGAWAEPGRSLLTRYEGGLIGTKVGVPLGGASHLVVLAQDGLYEVALRDVQIEEQRGTDEVPLHTVRFEGAPAERLAVSPAAWRQRALVGLAAVQLGLAKAALRMTSEYVSKREQFGRPVATFQAVSQRAADAWIEVQAMEVTLWQAAWQVQAGLDAERAVLIASWQASEGGHRVLAAAQHLHGGTGYDKDYPLYRYFLRQKRMELSLGGAEERLEELGELLARP